LGKHTHQSTLGTSDQVMNCFFEAKIPSFCVAKAPTFGGNLENSGLFSAIYALNLKTLSLEKLNPDLIRGSFNQLPPSNGGIDSFNTSK